MKKTLFTLMLMIASALAINAQSLTGKEWCTMITDEDGNEIALELKFENNGTCEVELTAVQVLSEGGMKMTIGMELETDGTYTLNGKDLKINLNRDNSKVDLDVNIKGIDDQTKAMMLGMMKSELEKGKAEAKEELLKVLPAMGDMKVVSLDKGRLVLADSTGEEMAFYAKATD